MTHGGLIYSALDDVMANWLFLQGARGHTAKCDRTGGADDKAQRAVSDARRKSNPRCRS
jgi:hypothetical protein